MKNLKVIFVNSIDFDSNVDDLPLGLMILDKICRENSYDSEIVDFGTLLKKGLFDKNCDLDSLIDQMADHLLLKEADVIAFYSLCDTFHISVLLSKRISEKSDTIIIFGGPQATLAHEDILKSFRWINYIGLNEGENTIVSILKGIEENNQEIMKGVAFLDRKGEICSRFENMIQEEDLMAIDYSAADMENVSSVPIDIGRGCPFQCTYCSTKTFWKQQFRLKPVNKIVKEISTLKKKYKKRTFSLVHDLFTVSKKRVMEFCDALLNQKMGIDWYCSSRLDTLDAVKIFLSFDPLQRYHGTNRYGFVWFLAG